MKNSRQILLAYKVFSPRFGCTIMEIVKYIKVIVFLGLTPKMCEDVHCGKCWQEQNCRLSIWGV